MLHVVVLAAAVLAAAAALPFGSTDSATSDEGVVHTGVGSEEEAREWPCPPGTSGPVVCVPDRGTPWRLSTEATGECSLGALGWYGDCVWAFDAGDHLRVWGSRGVPPRSFTITWSAAPASGDREESTDTSGNEDGAATQRRSTADEARTEEIQPPRVAAPAPPATDESAHPAPDAGTDPPDTAVDSSPREVPDGVFWDPPVNEVPGYSDLVAAPGPTYPGMPVRAGRGDAGAPAAAGVVALVAAGWVLLERQRGVRRERLR